VLIELRERRRQRRRFRVANTLEEYQRLVGYQRQLGAPALIGSKRPAIIIVRWRIFFTLRCSLCG
jgi:hypothetical protein